MTAQDYIQTKLNELKQLPDIEAPADAEALEAEIIRLINSKKFRKYANTPQLNDWVKNTVHLAVSKNKPINFVFTHGCYKLWRLEEAPQADWAELFALMHYTNWLKPVCAIYEPGVWFDCYVDDLILPQINNLPLKDMTAYRESLEGLMEFLKPYQPSNFRMSVTGVSSQFDSPEAFNATLANDIKRFKETLGGKLPEIDDQRRAMIDLNAQPTTAQQQDPQWREKITLIHDAYLSLTKAEAGYHNSPDKIRVFTQPLGSGLFMAVGSTKDSVMKFWVGAGVLLPRDDSFRQIVMSPAQLHESKFEREDISIKGLPGKNFQQIRIVS